MSLSVQSLTYIVSLVTIMSSTIYICFSLITLFRRSSSYQLFLSLIKSRSKVDRDTNMESNIVFTHVKNVIKINMLLLDMIDHTSTEDSKGNSKATYEKRNV